MKLHPAKCPTNKRVMLGLPAEMGNDRSGCASYRGRHALHVQFALHVGWLLESGQTSKMVLIHPTG